MTKKKVHKARVISDKMQKSAVVVLERRYIHPIYKKVITRTTKYLVHNPENKAKTGDIVVIKPTRPLSKNKRWTIIDVLEKSSIE
ncbi:MAG: 30S ribosomal protein S17 [Candidatus Aureabacteria bacterium]|nr:30S ribosomal protein S17 [Candidatus Auribacterota bacterium]